jgi:thymidylate synthase ThyX
MSNPTSSLLGFKSGQSFLSQTQSDIDKAPFPFTLTLASDLPTEITSNPERMAMLQALYSRSKKVSVRQHAATVMEKGSDNFLQTYVLGYGHDSIAECGCTTVFFEDVSILAAHHLQDFPLYSGIETSTRYIDFSASDIVLPSELLQSRSASSLAFEADGVYSFAISRYTHIYQELLAYHQQVYSDRPLAAIKAYTFDIARGFLPAGVRTNVSITGSLAKLKDWFIELMFSALLEVRCMANDALDRLMHDYPATFGDYTKRMDKYADYLYDLTTMRYKDDFDANYRDSMSVSSSPSTSPYDFNCRYYDLHYRGLETQALNLSSRQRLQFAQNSFRCGGMLNFTFKLDFGSFRDLHRHRRGYCPVPLVTDLHGFSRLYLNKFPKDLLRETRQGLVDYSSQVTSLLNKAYSSDSLDRRLVQQYFVLLGFEQLCRYTCDVTQAVYIIELRSSPNVHFSLRGLVKKMEEAVVSLTRAKPHSLFGSDGGNDGDLFGEPVASRGSQTIKVDGVDINE